MIFTTTTQLEKHLALMEMNSDHRDICQCYICLGKKLAIELSATLQKGEPIKWSAENSDKLSIEDFNGGFFRRLRDEWLK